MEYEIIREIKNSCGNNQMRDVFLIEAETDDPMQWVRSAEPKADSIVYEELRNGCRITVESSGLITQYSFSEI